LIHLFCRARRRDISHILVDSPSKAKAAAAPAKKGRFAAMIMKPPTLRKREPSQDNSSSGKPSGAGANLANDRSSVIITGDVPDGGFLGMNPKATVVIKTAPPPPAAPKPRKFPPSNGCRCCDECACASVC